MDANRLNEMLERLKRFQNRLVKKGDAGMAWSAKSADGRTHHYIINGIKDFDEIADDTESMFVWIWSCKDHLKLYAQSVGKSGKWVEAEASADSCLSVCADIANRAKHGKLRESRSGKHPRLGKLTCSGPREAIGKITFRAFEVELDVSNPKLVTFEMPVLDGKGRVIGDAFKFLEGGVIRWEELFGEIESAV